MFYSDTFPQIIQSFLLPKVKMLSGFAIRHPGQRRVPLLVLDKRHRRTLFWHHCGSMSASHYYTT